MLNKSMDDSFDDDEEFKSANGSGSGGSDGE